MWRIGEWSQREFERCDRTDRLGHLGAVQVQTALHQEGHGEDGELTESAAKDGHGTDEIGVPAVAAAAGSATAAVTTGHGVCWGPAAAGGLPRRRGRH